MILDDGSPREGNGNHSSILAWRTPWTEEVGMLQPMGLQRVRHETSQLNNILSSSKCFLCTSESPFYVHTHIHTQVISDKYFFSGPMKLTEIQSPKLKSQFTPKKNYIVFIECNSQKYELTRQNLTGSTTY